MAWQYCLRVTWRSSLEGSVTCRGEINSNQLPIRSFAISDQLISCNQQATESANDHDALAYQRIVSKLVGGNSSALSHWRENQVNDLQPPPADTNYLPALVWWGEEGMVSRWARPATVLNSYSLLTSLRQRAVNAGCMFAAFITLPYHCHESGTCSGKGKYFKHNDAVTRASVIKCKILKEVAD